MNKPFTADQLRAALHYDPATGVFTWRHARGMRSAGSVAGTVSKSDGYRYIRLSGHRIGAHRLARLYVTGEWPERFVDHEDGNRDRNVYDNLRDATPVFNAQNQRHAKSTNVCGLLGVSQHGAGFRAVVIVGGTRHRLGTHATPELAHAAYLQAKRQLHAGCTI